MIDAERNDVPIGIERALLLSGSLLLYVLGGIGVVLFWLLRGSPSLFPVLWFSPGLLMGVGGMLWIRRPRVGRVLFVIGTVGFLAMWILPIAFILVCGLIDEIFGGIQ